MLKTNSAAVKAKIRAFITAEATPAAEDYRQPVKDYLRTIYERARERVNGTCELPAADIVNSCTCFFHGDYEIFEIVQNWTESNYDIADKAITKAVNLYYILLNREIQAMIK